MPVLDTQIHRLTPDELGAASYERFARAIFGDATWAGHVRYCRWLYGRNPALGPDEPLPVYVYCDADAIVAQAGFIPADIVLDGEALRAGWCVDFFTLPSHRRQGIGRQLLDAAQQDFPLLMTLGQTAASRGLFIKCGWHAAGALQVYKHILRPLRYLATRTARRVGLRTPPRPASPPMADSPDYTPSASELSERNAARTRIVRSPAFVRWRYRDGPFRGYRIERFRHEGLADTHAVWRCLNEESPQRGVLVDLFYAADLSDADLKRVLAAVMDSMRGDGVELFECQTSDRRVLSAFPGGPLAKTEPGVQFLYGRGDGGACPAIAVDQWRLFAGDCDVDAQSARENGS